MSTQETYQERINRMTNAELARFLEGFDIERTITDPKCKQCKQDHGGKCVHIKELEETDYCPLFPEGQDDLQLIKEWLAEKAGPIRLRNGEVIL